MTDRVLIRYADRVVQLAGPELSAWVHRGAIV
jgi:hypothetical protein